MSNIVLVVLENEEGERKEEKKIRNTLKIVLMLVNGDVSCFQSRCGKQIFNRFIFTYALIRYTSLINR